MCFGKMRERTICHRKIVYVFQKERKNMSKKKKSKSENC